MGRCVECTKGRHMCPVPAVEAFRECCHCSTHSSPLFHFKDGRTLTSKSFRSTFLSLVRWSTLATIQPNTTPTMVQPCTVAARTGLRTRNQAKHTRHTTTEHVNCNCFSVCFVMHIACTCTSQTLCAETGIGPDAITWEGVECAWLWHTLPT